MNWQQGGGIMRVSFCLAQTSHHLHLSQVSFLLQMSCDTGFLYQSEKIRMTWQVGSQIGQKQGFYWACSLSKREETTVHTCKPHPSLRFQCTREHSLHDFLDIQSVHYLYKFSLTWSGFQIHFKPQMTKNQAIWICVCDYLEYFRDGKANYSLPYSITNVIETFSILPHLKTNKGF